MPDTILDTVNIAKANKNLDLSINSKPTLEILLSMSNNQGKRVKFGSACVFLLPQSCSEQKETKYLGTMLMYTLKDC